MYSQPPVQGVYEAQKSKSAIHATRSIQVVHENGNTSHTFLDNEMEQKCDVHDAGTKFW